MTYRKINVLSDFQGNFGSRASNDFGGWEVTDAELFRLDNSGFTYKYIPDKSYGTKYVGNLLGVTATTSVDTVTVKSPWVSINGGDLYMVSVYLFVATVDMDVTIDFELSSSNTGTGETYATNNDLRPPISLEADENQGGRVYGVFTTLANHNFGRMVLKFSGRAAASLPDGAYVWVYDPVISEDSIDRRGEMTASTYASIPAFMRLDDERIIDITGTPQLVFPLHRYTEALCYPLDKIYDIAATFIYTHPSEGIEYKSKLTDPDTADETYLEWLALLNGTKLFSLGSGSTPWVALQTFDSPDDGNDQPGQWVDIEYLNDWQGIQNLNPEFFDPIAGYRSQIRTGFTGINAGRTDTIEEYIRTLIDSSENNTTVVSVYNRDMDNPYRVKVLVDPNVDPDSDGEFLTEIVNRGLTAGATVDKTGYVVESGHARLDMTNVYYPAVTTNSSGYGMRTYTRSSVPDIAHHGRHLVVTQDLNSKIPEKGGIVAPAHFTDGSQYFYGKLSSVSSGYVETGSSSFCDMGGKSTGYDIIAVVSDITLPTAAADTTNYVAATPQAWYFREKRLLVSGAASAGTSNDWAVYLVSGISKTDDNDTRLMLIDGFQTQNSTNYAISDPLDMSKIGSDGQTVFRVTRGATSAGVANVTFYAQKSLYDEWSANTLGTASITPTSTSAGAAARIRLLGGINKAGSGTSVTWANASALPCAINRVMVYNAPASFAGATATTSAAHAYINGVGTSAYSMFTYSPTIDIDFSGVSSYSTSFNSTINGLQSLATTVNQAASASIDYGLLVARKVNDSWYFGSTADITQGFNRLTVAGASIGDNATHTIAASVVNTSTGVTTSYTHSLVSSAASVLTLQDTRAYTTGASYGGATIAGIDVYKVSPSVKVASFLPTTISSASSTGVDALGASWAISRGFPSAAATAYSPAQVVDQTFIHMYNGALNLKNSPTVEVYKPFSVLLKLRRFWNSGTFDIFNIVNGDNEGLHIYYNGAAIAASFNGGSFSEIVSWTESPIGAWNWVVVRRDPTASLSIVGNGSLNTSSSAAVVVPSVFTESTSIARFGSGALGEYNARFGLAEFVFFERCLSNEEITLLAAQIV